MKKRILTLLLAAILLLGIRPASAVATWDDGWDDDWDDHRKEYFGWNIASAITDSGSAKPFTDKNAYDAIAACVDVYVGQVAEDATLADIDQAVTDGTLEVMPIGGYYGRVNDERYTPELSKFSINYVNEKGLVVVARQGLTFERSSICCNDEYGFNCQTAARGNAGSFDNAIQAGSTKVLRITPDMLAQKGVYHQGRGQAWLMLSIGGNMEYNIVYNVRTDGEYALDKVETLAVGDAIAAYVPEGPEYHVFSGWHTDPELTADWNAPAAMPANDIVLYGEFTPRTDLTYTVHYYITGTQIPVENDKVVTGQTYGTTVTEYAVETRDFIVQEPAVQELTLTEDNLELTFYYDLVPPPIVLETGEHFNYVVGYSDGTVRPGANITRGEVVGIFFRLMTKESRDLFFSEHNNFSDVHEGQWYNTAISTLTKTGIIHGYPDGTFKPDRPITRAELAKVVALFANLTEGEKEFSDIAGHWAEPYILLAAGNGWIDGYPDGTYRPNQNITRAETMTLINRALGRNVEEEEHLLEGMLTWSDNMDPNAWFYYHIQEATNYHSYTRLEPDSTKEKWLELLPNIDWTTYEF